MGDGDGGSRSGPAGAHGFGGHQAALLGFGRVLFGVGPFGLEIHSPCIENLLGEVGKFFVVKVFVEGIFLLRSVVVNRVSVFLHLT